MKSSSEKWKHLIAMDNKAQGQKPGQTGSTEDFHPECGRNERKGNEIGKEVKEDEYTHSCVSTTFSYSKHSFSTTYSN